MTCGCREILEKENFLVVIIQGQMLEVESTSQKVILLQGFILSFSTIITWGRGESV